MGTPSAPGEQEFPVPPSLLGESVQLRAAYDDIVGRTEAFAKKTADLVRSNPGSVSNLVQDLVRDAIEDVQQRVQRC